MLCSTGEAGKLPTASAVVGDVIEAFHTGKRKE